MKPLTALLTASLTALLTALAIALPALAADTEPAGPAPDPFAAARTQIAAKRFPEAIAALKRVNATGNADWNNLMGYAQRKQTPPDLAAAERYYDAALKLVPAHLGALEYSGELYLMKGELVRAEARLAELAKACNARCEEHADLKREVERFKANGNKFVAAP